MNEVKLLNIGGIDQNVKDQYARDIIAPSENGLDSTSNLPVASRHYDAGEFLIGQDRLYYEALVEINVGDTLVVNSNIKATTVSDEIVSLRGKSADAAIECIATIESTGLSTAEYAVGEYLYWEYGLNAGLYKAKTVINIGDAFIVDTNIEAAETIEEQIKNLQDEILGGAVTWDQYSKYGVKNILPNTAVSRTYEGITATVTKDGKIVINGTCTKSQSLTIWDFNKPQVEFRSDKKYIATGCPKTGSDSTYKIEVWRKDSSGTLVDHVSDYGEGVELLPLQTGQMYTVIIWINNGYTASNLVFEPMIREEDITDGTYEPYARSNQELTGEVEPMLNVLGAKNLLPNNATTQLVSNVTFTVNSDGSIKANGTAGSANAALTLCDITLKAGDTYILSGGGTSNCFMEIYYKQNYLLYERTDDKSPNGLEITIPQTGVYTIRCIVIHNTTANNFVFKPMIRPASIKDDTYVPYAKTNRELTENVVDQTPGKSIELKYAGLAGYARDTNQPCVFCPFPFEARNTNYTVSVSTFNIDGVGDVANPSALAKYKNGVCIKGTKTMTYNKVFGAIATITVTFA